MYISSDTSKTTIDFGERDLDNLELPVIIKYKNKKYKFTYNFTSLQEFRAMYETRASFKAIPIYAVEPNGLKDAKSYLKGFRVVHLGNNKEHFFPINAKYNIFPEILQFEKMEEELNPKQKAQEEYTQDEINSNNDIAIYKHHTSDTLKQADSYKSTYWLLGFQAAGGFNLDVMNVEFSIQTHWRFNRWFGIYTNGSVLLGINGLSSSFDKDDDDDDDDDYYDYYYRTHDRDENTLDTGIAFGLGLDIYLTNSILLFGEANVAYFIEDNGNSSFGGIIRGGVAFQSRQMQRTGMRLNLFIEGIISDTISGSTPYFGAGIYF